MEILISLLLHGEVLSEFYGFQEMESVVLLPKQILQSVVQMALELLILKILMVMPI
jgi:hypothetical protein